MLRELLLSAIALAWSASSRAQSIPNPAHSCLESLCGPAGVIQPYSSQLKALRKNLIPLFVHDNELKQIELPSEVQATISDIIKLSDELKVRDLKASVTDDAMRQELRAAYYHESEVLKEEDLIWCRFYYAWNQQTLPDADQIEHVRLKLPDTVKAMKDDMEHLFGQGRFISPIGATAIDLPPSRSKFSELLKDHLGQLRQSLRDHIELLKKNDLQSAAIDSLMRDSSAELKSFRKNPTDPPCSVYDYEHEGDSNYPSASTNYVIKLSPSTLRGNPESREATIRHELAHSMIRQMKHYEPEVAQRFEDCLSQQHPDFQSEEQLEEDFADLLAMANWKKKQNPFCQILLELDGARCEYSDNTMYSDGDLSHSSPLFRILHFEFMKQGSISQACKDYLDDINYPIRFRDCLNLPLN